jgi:hypothetical protein
MECVNTAKTQILGKSACLANSFLCGESASCNFFVFFAPVENLILSGGMAWYGGDTVHEKNNLSTTTNYLFV